MRQQLTEAQEDLIARQIEDIRLKSAAWRRVERGQFTQDDPQAELGGKSFNDIWFDICEREDEMAAAGINKNEIDSCHWRGGIVIKSGWAIYSVPDKNIPMLLEQIKKLSRKVEKLGAQPIRVVVSEQYYEVTKKDERTGARYIIRYRDVEIEGQAPKFDGWTFAATLQRIEMEDGSKQGMLRVVPGQTVPREMAMRLNECDHCRTNRMRNDTYVVRHEKGGLMLVGSNCLKDFLGHNNPHALAAMAQYLIELAGVCEVAEEDGEYFGGGRGPSRWSVDMVLKFAASVIRKDGFMSRKKAREECQEGRASADTVTHLLFCKPRESKDDAEMLEEYRPTDADIKMAEDAREWARGHEYAENEYLYNLSVIARAGSLETRDLGLATAMVFSYRRETMEQEERKAAPESKHFGEVGKRGRFSLTFIGSTVTEGQWGFTTICRFREGEGNLAVWFASGRVDWFIEGETYDLDASVKAHQEYRDKPQTVLTRVSEHVEKVKKPRAKKEAAAEAAS